MGLAESGPFQRYPRSSRMRREAHVRFLGGRAAECAPTRRCCVALATASDHRFRPVDGHSLPLSPGRFVFRGVIGIVPQIE